ncbi:MAG: prolyl oligopeptidase family serine peptidase [Phycisphaerae bacterium]
MTAALAAGASAQSHPFSVHDMLAMDRVGSPVASGDGKHIAFTVRKTDLEANKGITNIWLLTGDNVRQITSHESSSHSPEWSADGKALYFLSGRGGSSQVWKLALDGGEAQKVTDLPLDVGAFHVSPDGKQLVVSVEVFPEDSSIQDTKKKLDEIAKGKTTGQLYDKLFFRHWDTWKDGRRAQLFAVPVAGGDPVALMPGMDADVPSKPFGGAEDFTITPDSKGVVFAARDAGREEPWSTDFDLFYAPLDGMAKPKNLTPDNGSWQGQPTFSPDGKSLAYTAMQRPGFEADRFRIMLMEWPDGASRTLTEDWDRSAGSLTWSADGKTIYTAANNLGQHSLFAVNVADGSVKTLVKDGSVAGIAVAGDKVVYGWDDLKNPVELYSISPDGSGTQKLTRLNDEKLAKAKVGDMEQFAFKGWNNETVYCYVVKPVDFDPNKKYPVAFLIHGGPQGSFGNHFHYRWNPQAYAGAGYAAVMVDFHGSTGYGQEFTDSITGHWGDRPLEDLQKGLAATLERYPWMDGERVGALGASYGGYMINWIAGNWPDRFKCLVNHDGNLDERMAYFDTEELWFPEWEHGGTPWDNPEGYSKHNPIDHIAKWKTPMLVIHGGKDYRVVDTQGMSTFTLLQRKGIPSQFLYFPDENHWVLQPANSILWHETVIAWLDRWLKE